MSRLVEWIILCVVSLTSAGTPAPARYYHDQIVDHDSCCDNRRWTQRYYRWGKEFRGPGYPIFCILGGEGNVEPTTGLFYPFITHHLAKDFGAFVVEPEHRFYGQSQPVQITENYDPREQLFTSKQALQDAMRLVRHYQTVLGCSLNRTSPQYCPVITVGGSYPGWLSAMARLLFPDVIDMAYAASAPMGFYAQQVDAGAYYELITRVADKSRPGCAHFVQTTLDMVQFILNELSDDNVDLMTVALGFCPDSKPSYIRTMETLAEEVFMIVGYTFANDNMANYPPNNETGLYKSCEIFASTHWDPIQKVSQFMTEHLTEGTMDCVDMSSQLPTGRNATISAGDWSGVGTGPSGESWDFQTCTLLVETIGFSKASMFPERDWTMDWITDHCQRRFNVTPQPLKLVNEWHFDDLVGSTNASHILFTNGLNDGWSVGGVLEDLSDTLLAINFENGAHHSDLSGKGPSDHDTPDIVEGFIQIRNILTKWLNEIQPGKYPLARLLGHAYAGLEELKLS